MTIKTLDVHALVEKTASESKEGNLFETVAILSKRSRQIASRMKEELDTKLSYFEGFDMELEDPQSVEEQRRISMEHEVLPEPTEKAIEEMFASEIYFRDPQGEAQE